MDYDTHINFYYSQKHQINDKQLFFIPLIIIIIVSHINFTAIDPEDDETVAMIKELLETRIRYLL